METVSSPCVDLSAIPIKELKGTKLEWSTVCKEGCNCRGQKDCLFCGYLYAGGPDRTRAHLIASGKEKHMKLCNPTTNLKARHAGAVAELRQCAKKETQTFEENARKEAAVKSVADITPALNMRPSPELVTEAWAKVIGAKGLPIDFVDDPFVREAIFMTARAGKGYIGASTNSCMLPHTSDG